MILTLTLVLLNIVKANVDFNWRCRCGQTALGWTDGEQTGGKKNYQGIDAVNELIDDHKRYFDFRKDRFPYLDTLEEKYEKNANIIKNRQRQIETVMNDYDKTTKLMMSLGNNIGNGIKPLYSESDIKRKQGELNKLRDKYNTHLNRYLTLFNLNNTLLLLHLYSKNENTDTVNNMARDYARHKAQFLKTGGQLSP